MHQEVRDWLEELQRQYPEAFACDSVLECGSYNVNGSVRDLFAARGVRGSRLAAGAGRGRGQSGARVPRPVAWPGCEHKPGRHFDTVISTEMLEHDPHWRASVQRMLDLVKPGGTLIITCAAPGRGEHELGCAPEPEYYREIGGAELADLVRKSFERVRWWQMPPGNPGGYSVDTYLVGVGRW